FSSLLTPPPPSTLFPYTTLFRSDTWGFKSYDDDWKDTRTLLRTLIDVASKGGNFLLNVGPTAEGVIPAPIVWRLREMGDWMKTKDRKSTRLNSSHVASSYAVFCL